MFNSILPDTLVQAGGWTILHSLWQGAIITLLLAFILGRTRQYSPAWRYHLSVGALFLLLGSVLFTFFMYYEPASGASAVLLENSEALGTFLVNETAPQLSAEEPTLSWLFPILLQVWLVGVSLMGIRMLGELVYLQRLRSVNIQAVGESWNNKLNQLKWQMGIVQPMEMRESLRVSTPMLVGWIKPVILLPAGMLTSLSPQQVECVLAHELAHVRRMDYLVNLIQSAIEVLLFFNPAVWWISAQIREEREHCCDELAVAFTGDRLTLVKTLAQLEEWRMQGGQLGLAFNGRPQGVLGRVQRLLGGESSVRIIGKGLWSLLFFCMATGLLAFRDQAEVAGPERDWENIGIEYDLPEDPGLEDLLDELAVVAPEVVPEMMPDIIADKSDDPVATQMAIDQLETLAVESFETGQLDALLMEGLAQMSVSRDTIPDEKFHDAMRKLQQEMEKLQQEMMNSQEMQRIQELSDVYQDEMRAMQERLSQEHGSYEKLMQEQQKMMREIESRHREMMESEAYAQMQDQMEQFSREYAKRAETLQRQFRDDPRLLEQKMDSLARTFEEKHEAFEKEHEKAFEAFEREMEAFENSPEMKALEEKMEAMEEEMDKLMEASLEPMEKEMEKLEELLEKRFERQMEALEEEMEKLEMSRHKHENRKEE